MIVDAKKGAPSAEIGRIGENNARQMRFYVGDVLEEHPDAIFNLLNKRPKDTAAYPVASANIRIEEGYLYWMLQSADMAQKGNGKCQLIVLDGETIVKSTIYNTFIGDALDGSGTPPEPWVSWVEEVLEAAEEAKDAAELLENCSAEAETLPPGTPATASYEDGVFHFGIPNGDPSAIINDEAGEGVTGQTWSANKLVGQFGGKADKADTVLDTTLSRGRYADGTVGTGSFAFGNNVVASGEYSHAEGSEHTVRAPRPPYTVSHFPTIASGNYAHAEGYSTIASGNGAHSEGYRTQATGVYAHAEGYMSQANGADSHTEGNQNIVDGDYAHGEGYGTTANHRSQHAGGEHNVPDPSDAGATARGNYVEIIGNGTGANAQSNARTLDWSGNERLMGDVYVGCNADSSGGSKLAKVSEIIPATEKGSVNGVASLDAGGKVPASQLPSYVDDIVNGYYYNGHFYSDDQHTTEITGEDGKIYVDLPTNTTWRWSGEAFVQIKGDLALGETSDTAYRGDRGKAAYDHASDANRITTAQMSGLYKIAVTGEGHVQSVTPVEKNDITALGIPGSDTNTIAAAYLTSFIRGANQYTASADFTDYKDRTNNVFMLVVKTNHTLTVPSGYSNFTTYMKVNGVMTYPLYINNVYTHTNSLIFSSGVYWVYFNGSAFYLRTDGLSAPKINGYTVGAAIQKSVDTSISSGSTSTNLPTSQAVENRIGDAVANKADKTNTVLETNLSCGQKENTTLGSRSIAFGLDAEASGNMSQSFGEMTTASGNDAMAQGGNTTASGNMSHAEGLGTSATADASHAEGLGTIANHKAQHVSGMHNVADPASNPNEDSTGTYIEIVGNGISSSSKSNARTLDWSGNERLMGDVYVGCNADSTGGSKVLSEASVATTTETQAIIEEYGVSA